MSVQEKSLGGLCYGLGIGVAYGLGTFTMPILLIYHHVKIIILGEEKEVDDEENIDYPLFIGIEIMFEALPQVC